MKTQISPNYKIQKIFLHEIFRENCCEFAVKDN